MKRFAFFLLLLGSPAFATTDAWPALHDVVGVASDDVLNIRSGPGTEYEIIGTLAHDATGIEAIRPSEDFDWVQINTGERAGWVSFSYVVPQPGQWGGKYPEFRQCFGTEPFWSLARAGGEMAFAGLDLEPYETTIDFEASPLSHRGRHSFRAGDIVGVLSNELCSDGMSDREYGWEVNLIRLESGDHFNGCCSLLLPAE